MTRSKASLLLLALTGCLHNSPATVLAPLAEGEPPLHLTGQSGEPISISFGDKVTATVFNRLRRDTRYRIVPTTVRLVCPSALYDSTEGYLLNARIIQMRGDTAIAALSLKCGTSSQVINYQSDYLLVRRGRRWQIATSLGNGASIGF